MVQNVSVGTIWDSDWQRSSRARNRQIRQDDLARSRAQARRPTLTKSFTRKADAKEWARGIEHKLDIGNDVPNSEVRKRTLADAIDRYLEVTLPRSKLRKNSDEQTRLLEWWKAQLGNKTLISLTTAAIAGARDTLAAKRMRTGKVLRGSTVNRHLSALSAV